eukprot:3349598-Amphidinium_carterae.1
MRKSRCASLRSFVEASGAGLCGATSSSYDYFGKDLKRLAFVKQPCFKVFSMCCESSGPTSLTGSHLLEVDTKLPYWPQPH